MISSPVVWDEPKILTEVTLVGTAEITKVSSWVPPKNVLALFWPRPAPEMMHRLLPLPSVSEVEYAGDVAERPFVPRTWARLPPLPNASDTVLTSFWFHVNAAGPT